MSLLTLDQSTLFYWTLSNAYQAPKRKRDDTIKEWNSTVGGGEPTSRAADSVTVTSHTRSTTPSLSCGRSRSYAPSVLTDDVKIISHQTPAESGKEKPEPAPLISLRDNGGLSDNDETRGEERDAALASPVKGAKRVTSEVCKYFNLIR
jgi:hypothetical protein